MSAKTIDVLLFNGERNVPCVRKADYDALAARLAEAAVKINNVAECLAYGMDPKACEAELRLIAKGAGYGPTDSASLEPKP